jgi:hypothetical protein
MTRNEEIDRAWSSYKVRSNYRYDEKSFKEGAKWADETMIDKVCKWLYKNTYKHVDDSRVSMMFEHTIDMIENFRKAMEE